MQDLEKDMGYLVGDCLLAAAFLSYMGPFLSNYRDELLSSIWIKQVTLILQIHIGNLKIFTLFWQYFLCSIPYYSILIIICSSKSWRFHALQASVLLFSSPKPQPCVTGTSRVFPPMLSPLRMELSSLVATGQPSPDQSPNTILTDRPSLVLIRITAVSHE